MKKDERYLSSYEELLVRLTHILSFGSETEHGLTLFEVRNWLTKPIRRKDGKNALQCLELEGEKFVEELESKLQEE